MDDFLKHVDVELTPEESEKTHRVIEVVGGVLISMVERMMIIAKSDESKTLEYTNKIKGAGLALDVLTFALTEIVKPPSILNNSKKLVAATFCLESLREQVIALESDYRVALEKQQSQN